ncbi:MAG: DUF4384 domain-containing protein [Planctomycetes bacterium]|nr:DUF4384 domain-containing protein [Planctomycetota bacterium]
MIQKLKVILVCSFCLLSVYCAALPIISQAAPLLIELAGKAFGAEHAQTVEKVINVMNSLESGENVTADVPSESGLAVDFEIVKEVVVGGRSNITTINDGDILTERDNYKVVFSVNKTCYVYVFQIDSATKIDIIFPRNSARQEVKPGDSLQIPASNDWFYLDQNRGVEHVYLVASLNPALSLEDVLKAASSSSFQQKEVVSVKEPVVIMRGIGGMRKGNSASVTSRQGQSYKLDLNRYSSAGQICITRWFRHE